jgi:agmatinase
MNPEAFLNFHSSEIIPGRPALEGCPLDVTCTYRKGTGEAPQAIRMASESIETYSPLLDRDLVDAPFADLGDLPLKAQSLESALEIIRAATIKILGKGAIPLFLGGEHTLTLAVVRALVDLHRDFVVIHLDAHSDLRDDYEGSPLNHATVIRRVIDLIGPTKLVQLGIRAGTREEFRWMREEATLLRWGVGSEKALLNRIGDAPVYLTLDLDVLDPACFPGTGNPEAGGWSYGDMERLFQVLDGVNIIAADVVELNPGLDSTGVSSITAAKVVRELLLMLGQ